MWFFNKKPPHLFADDILHIIKNSNEGIKAKDIAKKLSYAVSKKKINSLLYGELSTFLKVDENFKWSIKHQSENSLGSLYSTYSIENNEELNSISIHEFVKNSNQLSIRSKNALNKALHKGIINYSSLNELLFSQTAENELLSIDNFGENSLQNFVEAIKKYHSDGGLIQSPVNDGINRYSSYHNKKFDEIFNQIISLHKINKLDISSLLDIAPVKLIIKHNNVFQHFFQENQIELLSKEDKLNLIEFLKNSDEILFIQSISNIALTGKEREIAISRFTLFPPPTLDALGQKFSVTRERIRQLEAIAIKKMQTILNLTLHDELNLLIKSLLENLFTDSDFISKKGLQKCISKESKSLLKLISDKAVEKHMNEFFFFSNSFNGWFINQGENLPWEIEMEKHELKIEEFLNKCPYPFNIEFISRNTDVPEGVIKDYISNSPLYEQKNNFIYLKKIDIKRGIYILLMNRGDEMTLDDLTSEFAKTFSLHKTKGQINNAVNDMNEALIVGTGRYNLYANLSLNTEQIKFIANFAEDFLIQKQKYLKANIIYEALLEEHKDMNFSNITSFHTIFGICQDDSRFITKKGFMLGLKNENFNAEFTSLTEDLVQIFNKYKVPLSISEIMKELEETRKVFPSSLESQLKNDSKFTKIGSKFYLSDNDDLFKIDSKELIDFDF